MIYNDKSPILQRHERNTRMNIDRMSKLLDLIGLEKDSLGGYSVPSEGYRAFDLHLRVKLNRITTTSTSVGNFRVKLDLVPVHPKDDGWVNGPEFEVDAENIVLPSDRRDAAGGAAGHNNEGSNDGSGPDEEEDHEARVMADLYQSSVSEISDRCTRTGTNQRGEIYACAFEDGHSGQHTWEVNEKPGDTWIEKGWHG